MHLILPLPTIVFQILLLAIAIASEATVFNRLAGMSQRRSLEYAATIELLVLCIGWATFFFSYNFLSVSMRADIQALILQGVWSSELNNLLLLVLPIAFFLVLELKSLAIQVLDLWLKYPAPESDLGVISEEDTDRTLTLTTRDRLQTFFQRYQEIQGELAKTTVFWGHIASTGVGALVVAIQAILFAMGQGQA